MGKFKYQICKTLRIMVYNKALQKKYSCLLVILVSIFLSLISCSKTVDKTKLERRDISESVYASLKVQPDSIYLVYAAVGGLIEKVFIEEGDLVIKNSNLFQIGNANPNLNVKNAELALELAKENLNGNSSVLISLKDEINSAKLKCINDSINFYRQKNLWEKKIGSKVTYDSKKLAYQVAINNLNLLNSSYQRTKKELQTKLDQANISHKSALITTKDFTVKSVIKGKVYAIYKHLGELVSHIEPIATIGSDSHFKVEMLVDEVDIVKIKINQLVLISLDAYDGNVFRAKIVKMYPKKDERNQTFKVEALFENPPEILYPGLSGEANILISSKKNVLVIPKEYILEGNKVETDDGIQEVKIGLETLEFVEIVSGIKENTTIYKPLYE